MTISVINIGTTSNTTGATVAITVPAGGVPAGALIFIGITEFTSTGPGGGSVSDTHNTYTSVQAKFNNNASAQGFGDSFYAANVTALTSSDTITYTKKVSGAQCGITACYAVGITPTNPLDTAATAVTTGLTSSPTVTSGTPSGAGELFFGLVTQNSGGVPGFVQASGWATPPNEPTATNNTAVDGGNQVNAGSGTLTFNPTIGAHQEACFICAFIPTTITLSPSTLPNGIVGTAYSQTVTASGGVSPYTYTISSGALPNGLTIGSGSGTISGTPTVAGTFNFTVQAADSNSATGTRAYTIVCIQPRVIVLMGQAQL